MSLVVQPSPLEEWTGMFLPESRKFYIKRDDLLPFPLAGNKFRKLSYELDSVDVANGTVVTVGSVHSNHCRTAALMCARRGVPIHLVLHDEDQDPVLSYVGRELLTRLGATCEIVTPDLVRVTVDSAVKAIIEDGRVPHVIEGGCHTPAGVQAYEHAALELAAQIGSEPSHIVLASGTGATQAGLIVGCQSIGWSTKVIGVSVARVASRGIGAIEEAVAWRASALRSEVHFTDRYRAGGYGRRDLPTESAVALGWSRGLPLDPVYTGKAFGGLIDMERRGELESSAPLVFWHTGGLLQGLSIDERDERKELENASE